MMKRFLCIVVLFFGTNLLAQSELSFGWLPKVNISKKLNENLKWVNSIEAREDIYKESFQFSHNLVDVSTILSYRSDINESFNFGYILRFREGETIHRLLQHYNRIQNLETFKLAHRFGLEQFFQSDIKTQFRTRYRATIQKALSGEKVDIKEWYLKISNEYLYQFNEKDLEIRLSPYLGYKLSKKDKIEFGLDYRLGRVLETEQKNNLWFRTTWYISL
ncbi:conserved hypothetical protein [Tenacibaculum sp. 190524A05c]|uniref:DUF2490 domain-containing protein n=1 Tax=Tenacibaculum platacis TaxID=3137852 RepID=UPI0031FB9A34